MSRKQDKLALGLLAASLSLAATPMLFAGGGEVFCVGGVEIAEAWPSIPAAGLDWSRSTGIGAQLHAPGFPLIACSSSTHPDLRTMPGAQSLVRAAATWSNVSVPGQPGVAASTFALHPDPGANGFSCTNPSCIPPSLMWPIVGQDVTNTISTWEPASTFTFFGGAFAVGLAFVAVAPGTGDIIEGDICFNTMMESSPGVNFWSFVEYNDIDATWYATSTADYLVQSFTPPTMGYASLEGLAVHEIGHFAGLAHSLVDGHVEPTFGYAPSMFQTGHTESFVQAGVVPSATSCGLTAVTFDAGATPLGGLLGAGLVTLEADDVSAIASTYPAPTLSTQSGSISGTVTTASGTAVLGAHVVAVDRYDPGVNRVGTLARAGGSYLIEGLAAGEYLVYIEPVDAGPGLFFDAASMPEYVNLSGTASPCITSIVQHRTEFWDASESGSEASGLTVTPITVSIGATTSNIDFVIDTGSDRLTVRDTTVTTTSSRGIRLAPAPGVDPVLEFRAQMDASAAGSLAFLYVTPVRRSRLLLGEVLITSTNASGIFPLVQTATIDSQGFATFQLTVPDSLALYHLVAQVGRRTTGVPPVLSNTVSVFVERP